MCGFVTIATFKNETKLDIFKELPLMMRELSHRGPDSEGLWQDKKAGVAIGHRRLSIQDLTDAGSQPFVSSCRRWILAFNGEIYNHIELRNILSAR